MIEVDHLTKYYGPSPAVQDISFTVDKGEILGFLGPNGAGKSTTMRIITGYLPATSGTVYVDGYDVATHSLDVRRHVGYLPETVPLYTDISPVDYLDFMGKLKGLRNSAERRERIQVVMEQVRIDDVAHKLIGRLSKGYRQRVGLAQALLSNPDVLILDEPTVGLDPRQIIEIRELIKSLAEDHTVVLSTHILPEVSMTCSRVVIINRGRLVALDTPVHLTEDVAGGAGRVLLQVRGPRDGVQAALTAVPGVESANVQAGGEASVTTVEVLGAPQSDLRARLAQAIVQQNWDLLELRAVSLSLEDVFLRVTTTEDPQQEPDEAELFLPGEDEAYEEQEIAYEDEADEAAAESEARAAEAAAAPAARPRKGGRK
ncbi:MAG TPA: ATP-binding cassette domain-containing protein [Chloroflexia bacterium]|nr:ATP-binding cassette domain-containing protein [Chloroflexia bacterium]